MQYVVFKLGNEEYGFDIKNVKEIVRLQEKTKLPNTPQYIEGVVNLRGEVIPVLNLAEKFGLNSKTENDNTRLIVITLDNNRSMAIKTDEVTEVLNIEEDNIVQPPSISDDENQCLIGIAKLENKLILILDINHILTTDSLPTLEEIKVAM